MPAVGLLWLLWIPGCALIPKVGAPEVVGPPIEAASPQAALPDTAQLAGPPAAEVFVGPTEAHLTSAGMPRPLKPSTRTRESAEADTAAAELLPSPIDTLAVAVAPPAVSVELPHRERIELENGAREELAAARNLAHDLTRRKLSYSDLEKLEMVTGLIQQTEAALERDDIPAAANLAHKARVIAMELNSSR